MIGSASYCRAQDCQAVEAEPAIQERGVHAAEVDVESQTAVIEIAETRDARRPGRREPCRRPGTSARPRRDRSRDGRSPPRVRPNSEKVISTTRSSNFCRRRSSRNAATESDNCRSSEA